MNVINRPVKLCMCTPNINWENLDQKIKAKEIILNLLFQ